MHACLDKQRSAFEKFLAFESSHEWPGDNFKIPAPMQAHDNRAQSIEWGIILIMFRIQMQHGQESLAELQSLKYATGHQRCVSFYAYLAFCLALRCVVEEECAFLVLGNLCPEVSVDKNLCRIGSRKWLWVYHAA